MSGLYKKAGVYRIVHVLSGMTYIGSSHNLGYRLQAHKRGLRDGTHPNYNLLRLWQSSHVHEWEFWFALSSSSGKLLIEEEQALIDGTPDNLLLNICPIAGSVEGSRNNQASKERKRQAQLKRYARERMLGIKRRHSEESKKRMSVALAGRVPSLAARVGASVQWKGKKRPQSTREKMSAAQKEWHRNNKRVQSEEANTKRRLTQTGSKHSEETKERVREAIRLHWQKRKQGISTATETKRARMERLRAERAIKA